MLTLRGSLVLIIGTALAVSVVAQHAPNPSAAGKYWDELAAGNLRFASGKAQPRALVARRKQLMDTQSPHAAVLSCSDSRVPPELIFDQNLGDLFVIRSAGESA